ncbi:HotDog domain-containing protein, partial [Pelagophyceae sp. CCMP2097]
NFLASFHGGCLATTVDAATSVALIAAGACPGVSVSLTVDFVNGCSHDASVLVEAKVLRTGRNLAFTECLLRREADGVLMARATHVK